MVMMKKEMTNRLVQSCHPLICDGRTLFDSRACLTTTYKDLLSPLLLFVISPSCYSLSHILLLVIFSWPRLLTACAKDNFEPTYTIDQKAGKYLTMICEMPLGNRHISIGHQIDQICKLNPDTEQSVCCCNGQPTSFHISHTLIDLKYKEKEV